MNESFTGIEWFGIVSYKLNIFPPETWTGVKIIFQVALDCAEIHRTLDFLEIPHRTIKLRINWSEKSEC
jgi:hypothetical protein